MIKLMVPDMPTADELLPWLRKIDETKIYSNRGPLVRLLEDKLADMLGCQVVTVSNGTIAIELALRSLRLQRGSSVALPAMTFIASAQAVWNANLRPVMCDVDAETYQLTPATVRAATDMMPIRAVLPVASFGIPVQLPDWEEFARVNRTPVVIDAAGALTTQHVSQHGRLLHAFSLHATKFLGAGEGGLVACSDTYVMTRICDASNFGHWGTNAKMSEIHAAVALASLDRMTEKRERMAPVLDAYRAAFKGASFHHFPTADSTLMNVLLPEGCFAQQVGEKLLAKGIQTKQWYRPYVDERKQFVGIPKSSAMPVTDMLRERLLGLPLHTLLTPDDCTRVAVTLADILIEMSA